MSLFTANVTGGKVKDRTTIQISGSRVTLRAIPQVIGNDTFYVDFLWNGTLWYRSNVSTVVAGPVSSESTLGCTPNSVILGPGFLTCTITPLTSQKNPTNSSIGQFSLVIAAADATYTLGLKDFTLSPGDVWPPYLTFQFWPASLGDLAMFLFVGDSPIRSSSYSVLPGHAISLVGSNGAQPTFNIYKDEPLSIETTHTVIDSFFNNATFEYLWRQELSFGDLPSRRLSIPNRFLSAPSFYVGPYTLDYGTYTFVVAAYPAQDPRNVVERSVRVTVLQKPLQLMLNTPAKISSLPSTMLFLDAAPFSYDPDSLANVTSLSIKTMTPSELIKATLGGTFTWRCSNVTEQVIVTVIKGKSYIQKNYISSPISYCDKLWAAAQYRTQNLTVVSAGILGGAPSIPLDWSKLNSVKELKGQTLWNITLQWSKGTRFASTSVTVNVTSAALPSIAVKPVPSGLVNPFGSMSLQAIYHLPNPSMPFSIEWSAKQIGDSTFGLTSETVTRHVASGLLNNTVLTLVPSPLPTPTPSADESNGELQQAKLDERTAAQMEEVPTGLAVTLPHILEPGAAYTFSAQLRDTENDIVIATAKTSANATTILSNGTCEISPTNGTAFSTEFTATCTGFVAPSSTSRLFYSFSYSPASAEYTEDVEYLHSIVIRAADSNLNFAKFTLPGPTDPEASPEHVDIYATVTDADTGTPTVVRMTVRVGPAQDTSYESKIALMNRGVSDVNPQTIISSARSAAVVLSSFDPENLDLEEDQQIEDAKMQKRAIREGIITNLADTLLTPPRSLTTLDLLASATNVLELLTSAPEEMSFPSHQAALRLLGTGLDNIWVTKDVSERPSFPPVLAQSIANTISNVAQSMESLRYTKNATVLYPVLGNLTQTFADALFTNLDARNNQSATFSASHFSVTAQRMRITHLNADQIAEYYYCPTEEDLYWESLLNGESGGDTPAARTGAKYSVKATGDEEDRSMEKYCGPDPVQVTPEVSFHTWAFHTVTEAEQQNITVDISAVKLSLNVFGFFWESNYVNSPVVSVVVKEFGSGKVLPMKDMLPGVFNLTLAMDNPSYDPLWIEPQCRWFSYDIVYKDTRPVKVPNYNRTALLMPVFDASTNRTAMVLNETAIQVCESVRNKTSGTNYTLCKPMDEFRTIYVDRYDTKTWDDTGCITASVEDGTLICSCTHLTDFSLYMNPLPAPIFPIPELIPILTKANYPILLCILLLFIAEFFVVLWAEQRDWQQDPEVMQTIKLPDTIPTRIVKWLLATTWLLVLFPFKLLWTKCPSLDPLKATLREMFIEPFENTDAKKDMAAKLGAYDPVYSLPTSPAAATQIGKDGSPMKQPPPPGAAAPKKGGDLGMFAAISQKGRQEMLEKEKKARETAMELKAVVLLKKLPKKTDKEEVIPDNLSDISDTSSQAAGVGLFTGYPHDPTPGAPHEEAEVHSGVGIGGMNQQSQELEIEQPKPQPERFLAPSVRGSVAGSVHGGNQQGRAVSEYSFAQPTTAYRSASKYGRGAAPAGAPSVRAMSIVSDVTTVVPELLEIAMENPDIDFDDTPTPDGPGGIDDHHPSIVVAFGENPGAKPTNTWALSTESAFSASDRDVSGGKFVSKRRAITTSTAGGPTPTGFEKPSGFLSGIFGGKQKEQSGDNAMLETEHGTFYYDPISNMHIQVAPEIAKALKEEEKKERQQQQVTPGGPESTTPGGPAQDASATNEDDQKPKEPTLPRYLVKQQQKREMFEKLKQTDLFLWWNAHQEYIDQFISKYWLRVRMNHQWLSIKYRPTTLANRYTRAERTLTLFALIMCICMANVGFVSLQMSDPGTLILAGMFSAFFSNSVIVGLHALYQRIGMPSEQTVNKNFEEMARKIDEGKMEDPHVTAGATPGPGVVVMPLSEEALAQHNQDPSSTTTAQPNDEIEIDQSMVFPPRASVAAPPAGAKGSSFMSFAGGLQTKAEASAAGMVDGRPQAKPDIASIVQMMKRPSLAPPSESGEYARRMSVPASKMSKEDDLARKASVLHQLQRKSLAARLSLAVADIQADSKMEPEKIEEAEETLRKLYQIQQAKRLEARKARAQVLKEEIDKKKAEQQAVDRERLQAEIEKLKAKAVAKRRKKLKAEKAKIMELKKKRDQLREILIAEYRAQHMAARSIIVDIQMEGETPNPTTATPDTPGTMVTPDSASGVGLDQPEKSKFKFWKRNSTSTAGEPTKTPAGPNDDIPLPPFLMQNDDAEIEALFAEEDDDVFVVPDPSSSSSSSSSSEEEDLQRMLEYNSESDEEIPDASKMTPDELATFFSKKRKKRETDTEYSFVPPGVGWVDKGQGEPMAFGLVAFFVCINLALGGIAYVYAPSGLRGNFLPYDLKVIVAGVVSLFCLIVLARLAYRINEITLNSWKMKKNARTAEMRDAALNATVLLIVPAVLSCVIIRATFGLSSEMVQFAFGLFLILAVFVFIAENLLDSLKERRKLFRGTTPVSLPHWFKRIAWILCLAVQCAAAGFAVYRSMLLRERVQVVHWIIGFAAGIIEDIIFGEPTRNLITFLLVPRTNDEKMVELAELALYEEEQRKKAAEAAGQAFDKMGDLIASGPGDHEQNEQPQQAPVELELELVAMPEEAHHYEDEIQVEIV